MNTPQIIVIVLFAMALGANLVMDGKPKGNYSFWSTVFGTGIWVGLLYWGGFWK